MGSGKTPPRWINILIAAEEWGTPPWEIVGDAGMTARRKWMNRWSTYKYYAQIAYEKKMKALKNGRQ